MSWLSWIPIVLDAVLAVVALVKWKHAVTARKIGDVLIETIERAPIGQPEREKLKYDAKMKSHRAGVSKNLEARLETKGYSGKAA